MTIGELLRSGRLVNWDLNDRSSRQGLSLLIAHYEAVVYNFDEWHQALSRTLNLAKDALE